MLYPKRIETVHVETLEGELCIYDWQRMEVHNLNPTAATVWQLCDGQTSPQQMAARLPGDLTPAQAEELVWLTLQRLEKAHLLQSEVVKPAGRGVLTRRELLVGLGVTAALLPVISSIVAPGPVEAQSPVVTATPTGTLTPTATPIVTPTPTATPIRSQTFNFTGAEQQFTVPTGVTSVTIDAFGAQGGEGFGWTNVFSLGGRSVATIAVTAGETLFVYVGGQGGNGASGLAGAAGFNGGGSGGLGADAVFGGGGGGGASDVRQGGNSLANRVLVAGGSGGGGGNAGSGPGGIGGNGGGTTGEIGETPAAPNPPYSTPGTGGGGGTQISGGAGGSGGAGTPVGNAGANGSSGTGGSGGSSDSVLITSGGGGGGGGYFGGGGGGTSATPPDGNDGAAGGGGGGSSFAIPTATNVTLQQGVHSGNGQVVISW